MANTCPNPNALQPHHYHLCVAPHADKTSHTTEDQHFCQHEEKHQADQLILQALQAPHGKPALCNLIIRQLIYSIKTIFTRYNPQVCPGF